MYSTADLISDFERNRAIVRRHAEGLTHADGLIQPPGGGNCLNWTIGHLVVHRNKAILAAGGPSMLSDDQIARYTNESDPITVDGDDVIDQAILLELLDDSQARLAETLSKADLNAPFETSRGPIPLLERLHFLYFHDTYHTGQTELHRSLAGFDDRAI